MSRKLSFTLFGIGFVIGCVGTRVLMAAFL